VYQGHLMTNGWRNRASFTAEAVLAAYGDAPLAGVVMTDIDSDIDEVDAKLGVISGLASMVSHPVVAGGVVRNLDDVARLKYVANISGALVGRALFRKNLDLCDALAMAHPEAEEVASFI
jgi:phosphoribosylformimino-5-aminoimidazole carboxamide ribotide isomerase